MTRPAVLFIGGFADTLMKAVRGFVTEELRRANPGHDIHYFCHYQGRQASALLASLAAGTAVTVVGHSWGGHLAAQLAAGAARPFRLLVTIDPVGHHLPKTFYPRVRRGAQEWINVQAVGGPVWDRSNIVARIGRPYGSAPQAVADIGIDAPVTHRCFREMMAEHCPDGRRVLDRVFAPG